MQKQGNEYPSKLLSDRFNDRRDIVFVGKVVGLYGTGGVLKVHSFAESRDVYSLFSELLLDIPGASELIAKELAWVKCHKLGVRLRMKGVDSRSDAEVLVGSNLYARRSILPLLDDDTYFWSDLIGMSVRSICGALIGALSSIIRTGSNDVYVVRQDKAGVDTEILIPAIKAVVRNVDVSRNTMLVDLPDDLN